MKSTIYLTLPLAACILAVASAGSPQDSSLQDLRSPIASVRLHAVRSLAQTGGESSVSALIETLADPEAPVRREAAKALGTIKAPTAGPALIAALDDPDTNVRMYAAYALGEIKAPKAVDPLLAALNDPKWCVRDQAAWALREIGDESIIERLIAALRAPKADVEQVLWILKNFDAEKTITPFARLLHSPGPVARLRAVRALAKLQTPETFEPLTQALTDTDLKVRRAAVEVLAGIGDRRAEKPLLQLIAREKDPDLRALAEKLAFELSMHEQLDAYWDFEDTAESVARDITRRGNDGQIHGATPVKGKKGQALHFGPGKYVELGQPSNLQIANQPFTIMAWVRQEAPTGVVVARGGAFCGYSLYVIDGIPKFGIHREQDGPTYIATGKESLGDSWRHLAGVVAKDRIELYVDGRLAATTEIPDYLPSNCGQGMEIGFDVANSPAEIVDPFQGIIDEVKAFGTALSAEEIAEEAGLKQ